MINELNLLILFGLALLTVAVLANMRFKVQRRLTIYERVLNYAENENHHIMHATSVQASLKHYSSIDAVDIHAAMPHQKMEEQKSESLFRSIFESAPASVKTALLPYICVTQKMSGSPWKSPLMV